ncbi:MAG: hypothetical protein KJZ77_00005, partial [Anaerolineales bacterium]|nr:hypothetical protein [Anaerolineales bacterium]
TLPHLCKFVFSTVSFGVLLDLQRITNSMMLKMFTPPFEFPKPTTKYFPSLNWLTPLLIVTLPLCLAFITLLFNIVDLFKIPDRNPLQIIQCTGFIFTRILAGTLLFCATPLFFCATSFVQKKLGRIFSTFLVMLFSAFLIIYIWSEIPMTNIVVREICFTPSTMRVTISSPQSWIYVMNTVYTILLLLNLIGLITPPKKNA